jgi:hypothetical protein
VKWCISVHGVGASAQKQNSNACNTWSDHDCKKLKIASPDSNRKFSSQEKFDAPWPQTLKFFMCKPNRRSSPVKDIHPIE